LKKRSAEEYSLMEEYSKITPKYIQVKSRPWRDFQNYLLHIGKHHSLPTEGILVDIGTGNGRNLELFTDQEWQFLASDLSLDLLRNIIDLPVHKLHTLNNDMRYIPIRREAANLALCIASAHHLRSNKEIINLLESVSIILNSGGYFILSFWRRWKPDTRKKMLLDLIMFPVKKIFRTNWRHGDIYLPWFTEDKKVIAKRYYHLFTRKELIKILKTSNLEILDISLLGGRSRKDNFFVLLKKST